MKIDGIRNVIFITIDALRADHLGCYGYDKETSPRIDDLAKNSILFTQAISNSPTTVTSFKSTMTSTYPSMCGGEKYLSNLRTTVAEVLKANGYVTAAFHSNPFLSRYFGYNRGFDFFYDALFTTDKSLASRIRQPIKSVLNRTGFDWTVFWKKPHDSVDFINQKAISWLKENESEFFLWLHYMDVHWPYLPPKEYQRNESLISKQKTIKLNRDLLRKPEEEISKQLDTIVELYDAEIRYVDSSFGLLLDELEEINLFDETLIIITSDHGDEFLDHGGFGHPSKLYELPLFKPLFRLPRNSNYGNPPKLYDELIHVPLIIHAPNNQNAGTKITDQVQLLDIPPTIVDAFGLKKVKLFLGESLFSPDYGNLGQKMGIISENIGLNNSLKISLRTPEWKFIIDESNAKYELYNLKKDPKEKNDLSESEVEKVEKFIKNIKEHKKNVVREETRRKIKKVQGKKKI